MAGTANSGRKKLPAEDKKLRGTFRAWRENPDIPTPELITKVKAPKYLGKEARKIYVELATTLIEQKVLRQGDETFLEVFADAVANWRVVVKELEEHGSFVYEGGIATVNPAIRVKNKYAEIIKQYGSEFGLSPAARSNIIVNKEKKEESEFDAVSNCKIHSFGA